jgi:uncharacterized protein (UPF0333 family)
MRNFKNLLDDTDVLDINNTYPSLLVRKGMGLLFVFFVLLLGIMAFIPYPSKINAAATISQVSNKFVYTDDTADLKITTYYKKAGQFVSLNDKVALLINKKTGEKKELYAPFSGLFVSSGIIKEKNTFYILSLDKDLRQIEAEISAESGKRIKKLEKVHVQLVDNNLPLEGRVDDITSIPLTNKSKVTIRLNAEDLAALKSVFRTNPTEPINADISIYINNESVLNKAFGVLGDNFSSLKNH